MPPYEPSTDKRQWGVLAAGALCILLIIYLASPLIALHSIESAVQIKDAVALTNRIDFPALRRSLTKQIVQEYLKLTGKNLPLHAIGKRLAVSVADPVVARLMTVRAMLVLLGKGDAGEKAKVPIERAPFTSIAASKATVLIR
jgi:Protein of unknown function (DUF2939)